MARLLDLGWGNTEFRRHARAEQWRGEGSWTL